MASTARRASGNKTNWFAIWISVAVVVVLVAVGGLVVWLNASASGPGTLPEASNVNTDTGAIAVGTGTDTMDTYIDFMCPVCNQFEKTYGSEIQSLVDAGTITLNIHPISILDRSSQGTKFSTRAASAMYCVAVADPTHAVDFMQAMYANQPAENSSGLTNDQIVSIAEGAGVTNASDCINAETYAKYVTSMTPKTPVAPGSSGIGTPTIAINGSVIANSTLPTNPADLGSLFTQ
ncbi:DsbA family protein [Microbacterium rhizomatis]|uniref:Thioredoxin domain-containing protein n=1 Tax=Microbacterium rhizomatis TaxID=1631477 RepID=A0A5J5IZS5_9MICO|nr:thioredoxin domain-containing protein [Microbacterium rhizomatis]KAA9107821.1 thioredoxin domain-containing protein [Microbacterium rhizomatis]